MLKKMYRSLSEEEITDLFSSKHVKTKSNRFFHITWLKTLKNHPQFVVILPRKLKLSAPLRNRFRRRVYTELQHHFTRWKEGFMIAIVIKAPALSSSRKVFYDAFRTLLTAIG